MLIGMPYTVRKRGNKFATVTTDSSGDVTNTHGMHTTRHDAEAQMRALYAATNAETKGRGGKRK